MVFFRFQDFSALRGLCALCGLGLGVVAVAAETEILSNVTSDTPAPVASSERRSDSFYRGGETPRDLLPATPRSTVQMRLHESVFPREAEFRCSVVGACDMGLTRGLNLGFDVSQFVNSTLIKATSDGRSWLVVDGYLGYQVLDNVPEFHSATIAVGYRVIRYKDAYDTVAKVEGLHGRLAYAHQVAPRLTVGLLFEGMPLRKDTLSANPGWAADSAVRTNVHGAIRSFYKYASRWPALHVAFPAELEVANLKGYDIGTPEDIHFFARLQPFFALNLMDLGDDFLWSEQVYGLRLALTSAYESIPSVKFGRWAAKGSVGLDAGLSDVRFTRRVDYGDMQRLPKREGVDFYGDVQVSWQF